jgi:hypothetical protein
MMRQKSDRPRTKKEAIAELKAAGACLKWIINVPKDPEAEKRLRDKGR